MHYHSPVLQPAHYGRLMASGLAGQMPTVETREVAFKKAALALVLKHRTL